MSRIAEGNNKRIGCGRKLKNCVQYTNLSVPPRVWLQCLEKKLAPLSLSVAGGTAPIVSQIFGFFFFGNDDSLLSSK